MKIINILHLFLILVLFSCNKEVDKDILCEKFQLKIKQLNNSTLYAEALNGRLDYSYLWNNGETSAFLNIENSNFEDGIYSVTVTDASGCSLSSSFEISDTITGGSNTNLTLVSEETCISNTVITLINDYTNEGNIIKKGVCYAISPNPTLNDSVKVSTSGYYGGYNMYINNLIPSTIYYIRAFIENDEGLFYGNEH